MKKVVLLILISFNGIILDAQDPINANRDINIFTNVTSAALIDNSSPTFGNAWADINNDGYEDFILSNHGDAVIYMNNTDGTFTRKVLGYYKGFEDDGQGGLTPIRFDLHGVTLADVNQDYLYDLFISIGGDNGNSDGKENVLLLNDNGEFELTNSSSIYGIEDFLGRGRTGFFYDQNKDGHIDLFQCNLQRTDNIFPSCLYVQNPDPSVSVFQKLENELNLDNISLYFASLIFSEKEKKNWLLTMSERGDDIIIYDTDNFPFIVESSRKAASCRDATIGDFNGDNMMDYFVVTGKWGSEAMALDTNKIRSVLKTNNAVSTDIRTSFKSTNNVINVSTRIVPYKTDAADRVFIGISKKETNALEFSLDKTNPDTWGSPGACGLCTPGLFIWYNTNDDRWNFRIQDPVNQAGAATEITSDNLLFDLKEHGFTSSDGLAADRFYFQDANGAFNLKSNFLQNATNASRALSVVAEDFDNDMDLDLYISCSNLVGNSSNLYYENNGSGQFLKVIGHGGEGTSNGRGGTVISADYNNDGFIDVLVDNGEGPINELGEGLSFNNGPTELFRNNGNANHWTALELTSERANTMAIGSLVYCYTNGIKQMRLKGSQTHLFSQSSMRIHFGLGSNETIDSLKIIWPDGSDTVFYNPPVDSIWAVRQLESQIISSVQSNELGALDLVMYPNPTNGSQNVIIQGKLDGLSKVTIYSLDGTLMKEMDVSKNLSDRIVIEDIANWAKGTYYVLIEDRSKDVYYSKLMLQ